MQRCRGAGGKLDSYKVTIDLFNTKRQIPYLIFLVHFSMGPRLGPEFTVV